MKYIKHYYVQENDGTSFVYYTNVPPEGKTLPNILGLSVVIVSKDPFGIDYCYSTCDDSADFSSYAPPGVIELTHEQWLTEIQEAFSVIKDFTNRRVYEAAANMKRNMAEGWYLLTEISLFSYKKTEADLAIAAQDDSSADLAAPNLRVEANIRGITTKQLAQKIIDNFNTYMEYEVKISGARGHIVDQITGMTLDTTSFDSIKTSFDALVQYDFVAKYQELTQ